MKYLIATIKEQPWHVTLGFVLFVVLVISTVTFFITDNPQIILALIVGGLTWGLAFWSFSAFIKFVTSWAERERHTKQTTPTSKNS